MPLYKYSISGVAADEQTWSVEGTVETSNRGQFMEAPMMAMSDAFRQLTNGRAEFGKPGVGCRGPYGVTRMVIEELP